MTADELKEEARKRIAKIDTAQAIPDYIMEVINVMVDIIAEAAGDKDKK